MEVSLAGLRAFVTAGASGIGRVTALTLRDAGADVTVCDVDEQALATLPTDVARALCDVGDSARVDEVLDEVLAHGLDILVNNAGIAGPTKHIEDITDEEWRRCMEVGIDAQFFCSRRVVPAFKASGGGAIVNMVSTAGLMGYPTRSPYAAAKWASVGLTKTLAMELGPHGIRVNGIAPGAVTGDRMTRIIAAQAELDDRSTDEVRHDYVIGTSMQSFIEPQEIADVICFLCSDHGRHISGQIIGVDGHTETLWPRA